MMEIPASEIMTRTVITVPTTMPVQAVAQLLAERKITGVPVVDEHNHVVGVLSEVDLLNRQGTTAGDIMSAQVISANADTDISDVAHLFTSRRIRRVPILSEQALIGIVSRTDLMRIYMTSRWICNSCGYFVRGFDQPAICPHCAAHQFSLQRDQPVETQETGVEGS